MRHVGIKVCDIPTYEVFPNLESFQTEFEGKVAEPQCLLALEFPLKVTPSRWWFVHKQYIS